MEMDMNAPFYDLQHAFDEVSASSAGGAPFLMAYGVTFLATGLLSFFIPSETAALIALFQGGLALPAALWLERKLGSGPLSPANPLKPLSAMLAMSQSLGLPLLILVYSLEPRGIPLALAGLGGMHFLPYAWLQRTRAYAVLAGALSVGAFALQMGLGWGAFSYILLYVAAAYALSAPWIYRHASRLTQDPARSLGRDKTPMPSNL
jgi:hypothetical protein